MSRLWNGANCSIGCMGMQSANGGKPNGHVLLWNVLTKAEAP